jgi:hypothetical protein
MKIFFVFVLIFFLFTTSAFGMQSYLTVPDRSPSKKSFLNAKIKKSSKWTNRSRTNKRAVIKKKILEKGPEWKWLTQAVRLASEAPKNISPPGSLKFDFRIEIDSTAVCDSDELFNDINFAFRSKNNLVLIELLEAEIFLYDLEFVEWNKQLKTCCLDFMHPEIDAHRAYADHCKRNIKHHKGKQERARRRLNNIRQNVKALTVGQKWHLVKKAASERCQTRFEEAVDFDQAYLKWEEFLQKYVIEIVDYVVKCHWNLLFGDDFCSYKIDLNNNKLVLNLKKQSGERSEWPWHF